ncbi:MAG: hypothetical protein BGO98_23650 [Myxococcales bacterium 68-20]|nr:response regulator [Myxococcales bacterium]OJY15672.1 MAG: hypothetical protein BGO98_23650 [Myxococcales bacterium 68-20]
MNGADGKCPWFLSEGGACGTLARSTDWSKTPLGPISSWSPALRGMARLVLGSLHPMLLCWGPELIQLYNDAFLPNLKLGKHPKAMGQRVAECWSEAWATVGPLLADVMLDGRGSRHDDQLVPVLRERRLEEAYWTYSYSPVFEADGSVGGTLVVCSETTERVLAARRARTIRKLFALGEHATNASELLPLAVEVLQGAVSDVPFAAAYEVRSDGSACLRRTNLIGHDETLVGIGRAVAAHVRASGEHDGATATTTLALAPIEQPAGPWPEPVTRALIATVTTRPAARTTEVMVLGTSPRLPLDDAYRNHLGRIVEVIGQIHARVATTQARTRAEAERSDLLRQAPVATLFSVGREQRIELANQAFIEILGRDPAGETLAEAFPGIVGTNLQRRLDDAYTTGEAFGIGEQEVTFVRKESTEVRWFKFNVQPIRHLDGDVYGMMAVAIDITDTISTRNELEAYAAERENLLHAVEAASRAKDEFLAMLGHELRNPLAPITTALHLMKLKEPTTLAREREIIARQTTHLTKLVDDILDVARVSRGKVRLNRARIALADVIARAAETASPLFEQKRHTLTVNVPNKGLDVEGDALRLGQVFANLLTNAAKFTAAGGSISATAERAGDVAIIRVEDNGIGIPPDQLSRVFDAFFQEARSSEVAQGGLGLGLALVKSFVALHGGTVTAMNRPGGGSVFEVRLPALPPMAEPKAEAQIEPTVGTTEASEGKRVLLVDDSDDMLEIVASFLRFAGYEVMATHDAPSALRMASSFRPNVAVLDIGLPAMDGYDLAAHLREELGDRAPRMIAMTGYGREADRERALQAGFAAHLVKPVDPQELLASVRAISSI